MRASSFAPALCACFALIACTPAEPPVTPPAATSEATATLPPEVTPTAQPSAEPTAAPSATAAVTAEPAAAPAPAPAPDLVESPGDSRLEPAAALIKGGQHLQARQALTKLMADIDKSAHLDAKMAAHALLGRACVSLADAKCAAEQYGIVSAEWKDPDAAAKRINNPGGDEKARAERLRRALNAVGEALFHAGEEKRVAAEKERYPVYSGKGDADSVKAHINTKVAAWVKARRARIDEAEKAYAAVAALQPTAPPRWVVASAARVGVMWGKFVAEFRAAPIPKEWQGTGPLGATGMTKEEIRASYYAALDEASAPQLATARAAFKTCQELSQKFAFKDEYSQTCDNWLAKTPAPAP